MTWYEIKEAVETFTGLSMDALHVHVGVLAQIGVALLLRRSLASPLPWLAVLAAAVANEWSDLTFDYWPNREWQYRESFRDVWNTMLLPTVLLVTGNAWPGMARQPSPLPSGGEQVPSPSTPLID